ncbi:hypothetical protein N7535_001440 [Penicillium sp. DV-2018c]|nr:hypothetical protein N7535_001440 [Penicillium sp. DV-2018c]
MAATRLSRLRRPTSEKIHAPQEFMLVLLPLSSRTAEKRQQTTITAGLAAPVATFVVFSMGLQ